MKFAVYAHGCMSDASFFQQKMADANDDCSRICNLDSCKKISLMDTGGPSERPQMGSLMSVLKDHSSRLEQHCIPYITNSVRRSKFGEAPDGSGPRCGVS